MKALILPLALVFTASAVAEDEWVSVGANRTVAPAQADVVIPAANTLPAEATSNASETTSHASAHSFAEPQNSGDLMSELLIQMEQMQQEIAMLRSKVETQEQQLTEFEQQQQARYLDLDRRMASFVSQPVQPVVTNSAADEAVVLPPADAYKAAMTLVREKKFAEANQAFTTFAENYPQDKLVANAWYWNGEVYLVQNKLAEAKQAFEQVVNQYGDHQKAADAGYKLGVTLHKLGDAEQAQAQLESVISQYNGKADSIVCLAKSYLDKIRAA